MDTKLVSFDEWFVVEMRMQIAVITAQLAAANHLKAEAEVFLDSQKVAIYDEL